MIPLVDIHVHLLAGLDDGPRTLEDAVAEAKRLAGVKADDKIEWLILPKPKSFLEGLLGGGPLSSEAKAVIGEVAPALRQAVATANLFKEPAVLVMPYRVEVK